MEVLRLGLEAAHLEWEVDLEWGVDLEVVLEVDLEWRVGQPWGAPLRSPAVHRPTPMRGLPKKTSVSGN